MQAANVLKLQTWVQAKRQWINMEQPTQTQIASQAATDLRFKVSVGPLRDVMLACGLQTKRQSKHHAEVTSLREDIARQANIILKLVTASTVPEWLQAELMTEDLTAEVKGALAKNAAAS